MAFILLSRDGLDVELLAGRAFETRKEALGALPDVSAATDSQEFFIADLDDAVPVLIVPQPYPVARSESPSEASAGAWETPTVEQLEPETPQAPADGVPDMDAEEAAALLAPPMAPVGDLTDALRRAAGALESSGIVAPESVPAAPPAADSAVTHSAAWPWDVSETDVQVDGNAGLVEPPSHARADDDIAVGDTPAAIVEYVPDPLEEPARDVDDLVRADGSDEAIALGRPVIMGAYNDPGEFVAAEESMDLTGGVEDTRPPQAPVQNDSGLLADLEEIGVSDDTGQYEPGSSDIADLTCDECVYLNTCPKKGESTPASCGSFQWKSV
ncbi:MAG: hypothetical protein KGZ40_02175 [Clostridiales bacterium]|nr:hypothetical protein [Clostridiales bacterium]